jgi:hypothetical protein
MAEPTQFTFELKEAVTALIRQQKLHEGIWAMTIEFGMGAGNFGPTQEEARPSAFVQVIKLGLTRADTEGPLAIDAAKVNPVLADINAVKKPSRAIKATAPQKASKKPKK